MDQNSYLGLMALSEGFGNLSNIGAGRPTQQSQVLPLLMQQKQQEAQRARAMQALQDNEQFRNNPGLMALAGEYPELASQEMIKSQFRQPQQADPWAPFQTVGNQVLAINPETNQPYVAFSAPGEPKQRRIVTGPDGRQYYEDTQEPVLPNVQPVTPDPIAPLRARAEAAGYVEGTPEYREFMARNGAPVEAPKPADTFDQAGKLRDDFRAEPAFKVFSDVQDAANRIGMFYKNPGAVSDYGLAVAFAKIVDPGSVAREGEVAAVQKSGALAQSVKQALLNAISGEGALSPQMREEIVKLAEGFYKEQAQKYQQTYSEYQRRAERFGIDPLDALPDPLQSLSLRPVVPITDLPAMLKGSPPTTLRHPDTGETIYWDGTKIAPPPQ